MSDNCEESVTSDDDIFKWNFSKECSDILEQFPEIVELITKLKEHIKKQRKKICKLKNKLTRANDNANNSEKLTESKETQTENSDQIVPTNNWEINSEASGSIIDQVKQVAESAVQQTGFVYEETSGLYYDYNSGYYYDAAQGLYYDGNTGTYYYYDEESKSYKFHSQPAKVDKCEKRKAKVANKDEAKRLKTKPDEKSDEPEEGECSDSDSNDSTDINSAHNSSSENENDDQELAKTYPPCMRIIVKETSLPNLKVGSLFIVTCTGGSLGREGDHSVLIPDINISKHHAKFQYDETKKQYEIIDLGSRNGTLINGKRLSVAKQESEPFEIIHGSIIQVQTTKLLCHIHSGYETCGHCEPGLVQQIGNAEVTTVPKKTQHKSELKRLKSKFGVDKDNSNAASMVAVGYQDRAQARRVCVGSSNHHAKTQQSSVDTSIAKDNKGFKLLSKMGWTEGQSLGKDGDGRTEPVPLLNNSNKTGFGASSSVVEVDPTMEKKQALWRKTKQRYDGISQ